MFDVTSQSGGLENRNKKFSKIIPRRDVSPIVSFSEKLRAGGFSAPCDEHGSTILNGRLRSAKKRWISNFEAITTLAVKVIQNRKAIEASRLASLSQSPQIQPLQFARTKWQCFAKAHRLKCDEL